MRRLLSGAVRRPRSASTRALVVLIGSTIAFAVPRALSAQAFSDDFEAPTLSPDWVLYQQQFGTVALSSAQNNTPGGHLSLGFASTTGGQRSMIARRYLGAPMKGAVSVDFYDAAPGQETLYTDFVLKNSASTSSATLGTQDFDAFCYKALFAVFPTGPILGPNANCGVFPRLETTSFQRSVGWHRFTIDVRSHDVVFSIDSTVVYTHPGDFSFDMIQLDMSGPFWRPDTVAYFDNLSFAPSARCDIQLNQTSYTNGDIVAASTFRIANQSGGPLATELKSWIGLPGFASVSFINVGATGSVVLPSGFDVNLGPFILFPVSAAFPRGFYEFSCRVFDPVTGATLATSQSPFVLQ